MWAITSVGWRTQGTLFRHHTGFHIQSHDCYWWLPRVTGDSSRNILLPWKCGWKLTVSGWVPLDMCFDMYLTNFSYNWEGAWGWGSATLATFQCWHKCQHSQKDLVICELHKVSKTSAELGLLKGTCPPLQSVGTTLEDIDTCSFMDYEVLSQSSCIVCNATVVWEQTSGEDKGHSIQATAA